MSIGNINFCVQTMHTKDGNALNAMTPDKNGVYRGVPLTVLGKASRNNAFYDIESMLNAITNPTSRFNRGVVEGHMEGEWGHPLIATRDDIPRLLHIDRKCVSHYFTNVYPKKTGDGECVIIYGDIVPFGPYGKDLDESFRDPKRNTAFSLRSMTTPPQPRPDGSQFKKVLALVTFDAVDTPGFEEASKRFADIGNESLLINFSDYASVVADGREMFENDEFKKAVGFESVDCQEVLDIFKTDQVLLENQIDFAGKFDPMNGNIITPDGATSLFHKLF